MARSSTDPESSAQAPAAVVAGAVGDVLGLLLGTVAAVRGSKPLHPRGVVLPARLERTGAALPWGARWLDEPGVDQCLVRLSRAVGLPSGWPDVLGLALSFSDSGGRHDLLLATTGMARGARHVLVTRVDGLSACYGSLFTYLTPRGHAVLAAVPLEDKGGFELLVAPVLGHWQRFATLRLLEDPALSSDELVDLDPVRNPLPGLALAPLLAALREPAYAAARRARAPRRVRPDDALRERVSPPS